MHATGGYLDDSVAKAGGVSGNLALFGCPDIPVFPFVCTVPVCPCLHGSISPNVCGGGIDLPARLVVLSLPTADV